MKNDILLKYRMLNAEEVNREIFKDFIRYQNVTKCWRKENGKWIIKDDPFVDDWTENDYEKLIFCLKNTIASDGFVYAAFSDGKLKGFVSVESEIFGGKQGYCDLSSIHISKDMRRKGIGRTLFLRQKNGRNKKEIKSSTYLHTQPLKVKPFINQWGVLRQKFIIKNMLKMNRMIVN